jgi:predicted transcriptional regulator
MSADEVDAFTLGYYTGAVAHALVTRENVESVDEIAERVDAEMTRIERDGDEAT